MKINFKEIIQQNKTIFYKDLNTIIQVKSVKGPKSENAPFGKEPRHALDVALSIAKSYGFKTKIVNDAMGYVQWGESEDYIGIVGHLDVVPAGEGWTFPPFELSKENHRFYARGILDNKGPIMACLFALRLLKDLNIVSNKTIRIIFGTDEESGSEDIPLYLEKEKAPYFGFTPDCKYPVVYGERGIVNYDIITNFSTNTLDILGEFVGDQAKDHVPDDLRILINNNTISVKGKRSPSNAPELGINAITLLAEKIVQEKNLPKELHNYFLWISNYLSNHHNGETLGIDFEDEDSGKLIVTPYMIKKSSNSIHLSMAIRYPVSFEEHTIESNLIKHLPENSHIQVTRRLSSTNFPKNDLNVNKLSKVYKDVTGLDSTPVTTTGATYARFMPNIVAFGPSFPGQKGIAHNKDEYMDETDLLLNLEIYMRSIASLIDN